METETQTPAPVTLGEKIKAVFETVSAATKETSPQEPGPPPEPIKMAAEPVETPKAEVKTGAKIDNARRVEAIKAAKKAREIAQERDELVKQLNDYQELKKIKENAKEDPYTWLKAAGFEGPEEFTYAMVEKGMMTPERQDIKAVKEELAQLKAEKIQLEEQQKQTAFKQQLDQYTANITQKINTDDRFEFCRHSGGHQVVLNRMMEIAREIGDPQYIDDEAIFVQAATEIEEFREKEFDSLLKLGKAKSKVGSSTRNTTADVPSAPRQQSPRTINGKMTATTAPTPPKPADYGIDAAVKKFKEHMGAMKTY